MSTRATTHDEDRELGELLRKEVGFEIDAGCILEWVEDSFAPEEVFDVAALGEWAVNNGYQPEGRKMLTRERILEALDEIRDLADGDPEAAHVREDRLRALFIADIARYYSDVLGEMARLVLSSEDIAFKRWAA